MKDFLYQPVRLVPLTSGSRDIDTNALVPSEALLPRYSSCLSNFILTKESLSENIFGSSTFSEFSSWWLAWYVCSLASMKVESAVRTGASFGLNWDFYLSAFALVGSSPVTISLLVIGFALLIFFVVNELLTTRSPILAPRLFKVIF